MRINAATIPQAVTRGEELAVIPRSLDKNFSWIEDELQNALKKVRKGKKALREQKTYVVDSPRELLKTQ